MTSSVLGDISNLVQGSRFSTSSWSFKKPGGMPSQAKARADQLDRADERNPQRASQYASDIFANLKDKEALFLPRSDYMEHQRDLNPTMRAILIDWLVEVHVKYRLRYETLFLTVNIIDRYLSLRQVARKKFQLLGCVAMLIASKYEEIDPPKVREFAYITDNTYSRREIVNMESVVLMAVDHQITVPTPAHWLDRLARVTGCVDTMVDLARYLLELALMDVNFVRYPPSLLAGAAIQIVFELKSGVGGSVHQEATEALKYHTGHADDAFRGCISDLRAALEAARTADQQAVRRKHRPAVAAAGLNTWSYPEWH